MYHMWPRSIQKHLNNHCLLNSVQCYLQRKKEMHIIKDDKGDIVQKSLFSYMMKTN